MVIAESIIAALTFYFFLKVLFMKPHVDVREDSYSDNDPPDMKQNAE